MKPLRTLKTPEELREFTENLRAEVAENRKNPDYYQPAANWLMKKPENSQFIIQNMLGDSRRAYVWSNSLLYICDIVCARLEICQTLGNGNRFRIVARDIVGGKFGKKYVIFEN